MVSAPSEYNLKPQPQCSVSFATDNICKSVADPCLLSLTAKCQLETGTSYVGPSEGMWSCNIMIIIIL